MIVTLPHTMFTGKCNMPAVGMLAVDKLTVGKLAVDKLVVDKLAVDQLVVDKLAVDRQARCTVTL